MKTFKDNAGRTWTLSIDVAALKRVRGVVGVDLLKLMDDDPPLIARLATDIVLLCDVVYALAKPQADALGVTDEEFGAALGGDAISCMHEAFYDELVSFFLSLGRKDIVKAVSAQRRLILQGIKAAEMQIDRINVDAEVEKAFGASSTSSPEPSESIPTV
jgi:hypothetical protein